MAVSTYQKYPYGVQRAGMARLLYMHKFGGLYVDLDFECLRPLDELMDQDQPFMGREFGGLGWIRNRRDSACDALLGSPPKHAFWLALLERMVAGFRQQRLFEPRVSYVLATAGPKIFDEAVHDYLLDHGDLTINPHELFYASAVMEKNPNSRRYIGRKHNSYAVHHVADDWFSPGMRTLMWAGHYLRRPFTRRTRK